MKNTLAKLYLFIVILAGCTSNKDVSIVSLSPQQFDEKQKATPDGVLLDVRTMEEVQQGRIKGEVNFDFKAPEFDVLIQGMDRTKPYFVYCASGVRSAKAADKMKDLGFEKIYLLDGGIKAWEAAGLPVQK